MAVRLERKNISVCPDLQERRQEMWKLLHNCRDLARKQCTLEGIAEKERFLAHEPPMEQAGFRRGRRTRDHITDIRWVMERARAHQQHIYVFHRLHKGIRLCRSREHLDHLDLKEMGGTYTAGVLLRNMYANQEAAVKTALGDTAEFDIGKGVRKG